MSDAVVESRRFRTWDESRSLEAEHRVRLLIKAQFLRYRNSWPFWLVFGLAVIGAIAALMSPFTELDWQGYARGDSAAFSYFWGAGNLLAVTALLFGAATVSEDLRFNAPLFYFSRPVRVWDYVLAKVGFTMALMGLFVGMGLVTTLIATLLTIRTDAVSARAISSLGDWMFLAALLVVSTITVTFFLASTAVAVSSFTRRAWHAGIGLIVLLVATGAIGLGLGFVMTNTAYAALWGPFGWVAGATFLPAEAYFGSGQAQFLKGAPVVAALSNVFLVAWGVAAVRITHARVTKMEGAL